MDSVIQLTKDQAPFGRSWISGITTTRSCEGHKDRGLPFPWVDIDTYEPEGWQENEVVQELWRQANLAQKQKVQAKK